MWQDNRSYEQEILDLGDEHYTELEYDDCLKKLSTINVLLGGNLATKKAMMLLKNRPSSILDVGCGGGYLCHFLRGLYPKAKIVGIDISKKAVIHATKNVQDVLFEHQIEKTLNYPENSFDVVTSMLVCHHMDDEEMINFLKESYKIASKAVIINDLQRHFLAYAFFSCIAPVFFRNRLIWHDGRISIKRAFRKNDFHMLLEKAGFSKSQYILKWNFPFRWTLTLIKS